MSDKIIENNQVTMIGEIVSEFEFSHEVYGEGFYLVDISVSRLSDSVDYIPLMVSERLVDVTQSYIGETISVSGQFRSYNRHEEKKNRLILSVFVRELEFVDEIEDDIKSNQIYLDGYICKSRSTEKHHLAERLRIFWLQSTVPMGNQTISHVSAGEEMRDMPPHLRWEAMSKYMEESRAGNILKKSVKSRQRSVLPMKYLSIK